jgi:hypothetical protein
MKKFLRLTFESVGLHLSKEIINACKWFAKASIARNDKQASILERDLK